MRLCRSCCSCGYWSVRWFSTRGHSVNHGLPVLPIGVRSFPFTAKKSNPETMTKKLTLVLICLCATVRLHAQTGLPDPTFLTGSGPDNYITAMAQQADGKLLIGGLFTFYDGTFRSGIARLNSDGTVDPSFSAGTGFTSASVPCWQRMERAGAVTSVLPGHPAVGAGCHGR